MCETVVQMVEHKDFFRNCTAAIHIRSITTKNDFWHKKWITMPSFKDTLSHKKLPIISYKRHKKQTKHSLT